MKTRFWGRSVRIGSPGQEICKKSPSPPMPPTLQVKIRLSLILSKKLAKDGRVFTYQSPTEPHAYNLQSIQSQLRITEIPSRCSVLIFYNFQSETFLLYNFVPIIQNIRGYYHKNPTLHFWHFWHRYEV